VGQFDTYDNLINFIKEDVSSWEKRIAESPIVVKPKKHPIYPIYKLKYNQFESDFSNPVVRCCRGSVVEVIGDSVKMVQAPYFKFVNKNEGKGEDSIDFSKAWLLDKVDGSLILFSRYKDQRLWTTNGSFETTVETPDVSVTDKNVEPDTIGIRTFQGLIDYSLKQVEYFDKNGNDWPERIPEGWTLMLELLSPRNRVICKYAKTELVLHGARKPNGEEVTAEKVKAKFDIPFRVPERYEVSSIKEAEAFIEKNYTNGMAKEGVVICDHLWNRVKVKSNPYLQLKYVKGENNFNDKAVFEAILSGQIDDCLAAWPEITDRVNELKSSWRKLKDFIISDSELGRIKYEELLKALIDEKLAKKEYAFWVNDQVAQKKRWLFLAKSEGNLTEEGLLKQIFDKIDFNDFKDLCRLFIKENI
jgi:hypothetical protein